MQSSNRSRKKQNCCIWRRGHDGGGRCGCGWRLIIKKSEVGEGNSADWEELDVDDHPNHNKRQDEGFVRTYTDTQQTV